MSDTVHHLDEHGRVSIKPRPDWANDPDLALSKEAVEKFNDTDLAIPPRMKFGAETFDADIVTRGEGDLIYHFHGIKHDDFKQLLADVVESHFGDTDDFKVDYVPELKAYGLLAKGVRKNPMFNLKFYTEDFLWLLDGVLKEA